MRRGKAAGNRWLFRCVARRSSGPMMIALAAALAAGCMDNFNVGVSGHVRSRSDSSPVAGALVLMGGHSVTTDSNGYYQFGGYSPANATSAEILLTVTDVDGEANGVFVSRDSLVILDGTQYIQDVDLNIDLCVEMVANEPDSGGV